MPEGGAWIAIESASVCGSDDVGADVVAYRQTFHLAAEGYHWTVVAVHR